VLGEPSITCIAKIFVAFGEAVRLEPLDRIDWLRPETERLGQLADRSAGSGGLDRRRDAIARGR